MSKKEFEVMHCVLCGRDLPYPSMFPVPIYAECFKCLWDKHVEREHPPTRKQKREMKKKIKKRVRAEVQKEFKEKQAHDRIQPSA